MLTLGRKEGEQVVILHPQGNIVITLLDLQSPFGGVKLGFDAPPGVKIMRVDRKGQLHQRAERPRQDAAE